MFLQNLIDNWWKTKEQTPKKEKHGWSSEPSEEPSGRGMSGEQSSKSTKIKDSSKNSMMVLREGVRRLSRHEESDWKHPSGEHIGFCIQNLKDFYTTVPLLFECQFLFFCPWGHYVASVLTDTLFGNKPWASEMSTKVFTALRVTHLMPSYLSTLISLFFGRCINAGDRVSITGVDTHHFSSLP